MRLKSSNFVSPPFQSALSSGKNSLELVSSVHKCVITLKRYIILTQNDSVISSNRYQCFKEFINVILSSSGGKVILVS
jgi:hypothetical protein